MPLISKCFILTKEYIMKASNYFMFPSLICHLLHLLSVKSPRKDLIQICNECCCQQPIRTTKSGGNFYCRRMWIGWNQVENILCVSPSLWVGSVYLAMSIRAVLKTMGSVNDYSVVSLSQLLKTTFWFNLPCCLWVKG